MQTCKQLSDGDDVDVFIQAEFLERKEFARPAKSLDFIQPDCQPGFFGFFKYANIPFARGAVKTAFALNRLDHEGCEFSRETIEMLFHCREGGFDAVLQGRAFSL